jgi:SHS2 domain-containing protein
VGEFKYLNHTADMGFVARGKTLEEAFEEAARALFSFMIDLKKVEPKKKVEVVVEGEDPETLLFNWLNELLFQAEHNQMLFSRFKVSFISPKKLEATLWGEKLNPRRHQVNNEVKACTYYLLKVEKEKEGFRVQAVCDV